MALLKMCQFGHQKDIFNLQIQGLLLFCLVCVSSVECQLHDAPLTTLLALDKQSKELLDLSNSCHRCCLGTHIAKAVDSKITVHINCGFRSPVASKHFCSEIYVHCWSSMRDSNNHIEKVDDYNNA